MSSNESLSLLDRIIIETVEGSQGCKITELSVTLIANLYNKDYVEDLQKNLGVSDLFELIDVKTDLSADMINSRIEHLIKTKEILSIEYILPKMNYRVKTFLLPKDTEVSIITNP